MKRFYGLLCALFLTLGCATEADKAQWEEAMKDLRGENMQMKMGGVSGRSEFADHSLEPKVRD